MSLRNVFFGWKKTFWLEISSFEYLRSFQFRLIIILSISRIFFISWFTKRYTVCLKSGFKICTHDIPNRYVIYVTYKHKKIASFKYLFCYECLIFQIYFNQASLLINGAPDTEASLEPYQTLKMRLFTEIVNGPQSLTIFVKSSIFDTWYVSEYVSATYFYLILLTCKNGVIIS